MPYGFSSPTEGHARVASRRFCYPGILFALLVASPAAATDFDTLKCTANQDRVWVYDSLTSFDIEAKLPCGDRVEIVSRVKGYAKIRTATGVEGYVPENVFPDLPPFVDDQDKPSKRAAVSVAAAATSAKPSATELEPAKLSVTASAQPVVEATPVKPGATPVAAVPAKPAVVAVTPLTPAAAPAAVVTSAATPTPVLASASAQPKPAPARATPLIAKATNPPPPPAVASKPPLSSNTKTASTATPAVPPRPQIPSVAPPAPRTDSAGVVTVSESSPAKPAMPTETAPDAYPVRGSEFAKRAAPAPESEDYPDEQPVNESADPACRVYFSAYGLGATQFKWFAENRRKEFASICPAPNLASVDFVILFTHDTDSYNSALPASVHTDPSGFSDFNPLTPVDPALMSLSDADKAHYALAWVFRVKRGSFDPDKFSPRRRPQFSTVQKGSRASVRAVEDSLNFIEQEPGSASR